MATTVTHHRQGKMLTVIIVETAATSTTETTLTSTAAGTNTGPADIMPIHAALVRQSCALTSGTATTIDPVLGTITNPGSRVDKIIVNNATAAAAINNVPVRSVSYYAADGLIYHRSVTDSATADGAVTTEYLFVVEDWA